MGDSLPLPGGESGDRMWRRALESYRAVLTDEQCKRIESVTSVHQLTTQVIGYRKQYSSQSRHFTRLSDYLGWFDSFHQRVANFLQASPAEFVFVWGSLSFLLEVPEPPSPTKVRSIDRAFLPHLQVNPHDAQQFH